jgi:hypothetical protein
LPKLGIRPGRGGGNSPLNPPGNNPGGGGLFPGSGGTPASPAPKKRTKSDNDGDFVDRVEGDERPDKSL